MHPETWQVFDGDRVIYHVIKPRTLVLENESEIIQRHETGLRRKGTKESVRENHCMYDTWGKQIIIIKMRHKNGDSNKK